MFAKKFFLTLMLITLMMYLANESWALVDYSDNEDDGNFTPRSSRVVTKAPGPRKKKSSSGGFGFISSWGANLGYENIQVKTPGHDDSVNSYLMGLHLETEYNVYLSVGHHWFSTNDRNLASSAKTESGNTTAIVGLHWLKMGDDKNGANFDFYLGAVFPHQQSPLASTRQDKIVGVETAKGLGRMSLGIGYELRLTQGPKLESELSIGDIQILKAAMSLQATNDIRVLVEASSIKINPGDNEDEDYRLDAEREFIRISPALYLGIFPSVNWVIGANFRTKEDSEDSRLVDARLWEISGVYGNSVFTRFVGTY